MHKRLTAAAITFVALLVPAAASADTTIAPGANAGRMTALGGTVVWVTGDDARQRLMMYTAAGGVRPVPGAATQTSYPSIDLGRDTSGRLVLTYLRCDARSSCRAYRDDLAGRRIAVPRLAAKRCSLTTAPAYWRTTIAFAQRCTGAPRSRGGAADTGLYVKSGAKAPRRMRRPKEAVDARIDDVTWVDLHGDRVAAVVADVSAFAYTQTTAGRGLRSFFVASSEGVGDATVQGFALSSASSMWTLVGARDEAVIGRARGACFASERLLNPDETEPYDDRPTGLAADGDTLYLATPAGVVKHDFRPRRTCA